MILVTGSNGLLGSALAEHLGPKMVGLDLQPAPARKMGAYRQCDLTRSEQLTAALDELKPEAIIHAAAMTAVDACETQREMAWGVNVDVTAHLARHATNRQLRFIYVSTDYVFDGVHGNYSEESPVRPLGTYAVTKAAGELAVKALCPTATITRTAVPFGPFSHVKKDFVRWLREELRAKRAVRVVTDQVSNPTYVMDLARMLVAVLPLVQTQGQTLHLTGATALNRFELARLIARMDDLDQSLIAPILTADLKQASPRPLNAGLRVERAKALGLAPLEIEAALTQLKRDEARFA